jgi:hypothetical protein
MEMSVDEPFAKSSLKTTMALARQNKKKILQKLSKEEGSLPFEDRVLIWLSPKWKEDVERYHKNDGKGMADRFDHHQLEQFDNYFCATLRSRLGL